MLEPEAIRACRSGSNARCWAWPLGLYYRARQAANDDEDLALMRRIDELYLEHPFLGVARMAPCCEPRRPVNRKRVQRLMRLMGMEAHRPEARTLSSRRRSTRSSRTCCAAWRSTGPTRSGRADITYIPMGRGFLYLVAIIDWDSRAVLAWRLSNTLDARSASRRSRRRWRASASRRSSTPTRARSSPRRRSPAAGGRRRAGSHGRRGRCLDNVFVERLWRSLKYEEVYPRPYANVHEAWAGISRWLHFYNHRRPHQAPGLQHSHGGVPDGPTPLAA